MVDSRMKELQQHGDCLFPVAAYDWHASVENKLMLECHWHDECEFFCIVQGVAFFSIDGIKTLVAEGDVVFVSGGRLHMAESVDGKPFKYRVVVFGHNLLYGIDDIVQSKYIRPMIEQKIKVKTLLLNKEYGGNVSGVFQKLFTALMERPPVYEITCKAYLLELLAYVFTCCEYYRKLPANDWN